MRPLLAVFSTLVAVGFVPTLSAQTIGVYRDQYAVDCPVIPPFGPLTVYVVATLGPAACGGITGAEFRLEGWPTSWFYSPMQGPGIPIDGNPFQEGARVAFGCQTSEPGAVVVLPIMVFATTQVSDLPVTVVAHASPADPQFACPVLKLCDAPVFTSVCATGIQTRINPLIGFCLCQELCYGSCPPIAVERNSWSGIKRLYD
jgi:hypothetical protein